MRLTLRRSCAACAKAKHRCDLQTPRCSRCTKRNTTCVFANEPLTSKVVSNGGEHSTKNDTQSPLVGLPGPLLLEDAVIQTTEVSALPLKVGAGFDPFDAYPQTSLPRMRVQGLIYHFLSKIAFQYYPLDLNPTSNPFVVSWWPLALTDPALFHVSLQTASLDDELLAEKGFPDSQALMADSVALVRRKVQNPSLACQDSTMDAVVTLAAIELGKGNLRASEMHISGAIRMVQVRGGLQEVNKSSPITARMIPWVAMIVMGAPQFPTQDDAGNGDGVSAIPIWVEFSSEIPPCVYFPEFEDLGIDPLLQKMLSRLQRLFRQCSAPSSSGYITEISTTDLHDLTCFVLHRLLSLPCSPDTPFQSNIISECVRSAMSIYMLIIHGPTYYSHATLLASQVCRLRGHLLEYPNIDGRLNIWFLSIGMVGSQETNMDPWFFDQLITTALSMGISTWEEVCTFLKSVLWLDIPRARIFRQLWEEILDNSTR
ncbi:hypothetical protein BJ875DRAFT_287337 [Amylocarpus encephaloides]|uniref:Zn(2)-C6 fungal-type domain-containing protein n=1 Tax=Amylocarpus encephaloides TaxID=45428 RepID=A0A9P7YJK9_9HELO|nr:hypothetical protein BJ875DRAFT_287337 [Amylocarpus encephaloides]